MFQIPKDKDLNFVLEGAICDAFNVIVVKNFTTLSIIVSDTVISKTLRENAERPLKETYEKLKKEREAGKKEFKP